MTLPEKIRTACNGLAERRPIVRSVLALIGSNLTSSVLVAMGGLLVARFLGPDVTGSFRVYSIPLTYLMFLHLGTFDGLWRQIPYYVGKEMPEQVERLAAAAGAFNLCISAVGSGGFACCALYRLLHRDYFGFCGWLTQAVYCWEIFYGGYLTSTYRTLHHFVTLARVQVTQIILTFGMVFLLPFLRFYGLCARVAMPSLLALLLFHRNRPLRVAYRFDRKALVELIRIGLPYSFWGTLYTSAWVATESALILSLDGVTALGLFSVAYAVRGAMDAIPLSVWQVLTPRVVTNFAREGSVRSANPRIFQVTAGLAGFMVVCAGAGAYLLNILVPCLLPKYSAGIPAMKLCLWFSVVQAAFLPINVLFATGKPWLYGRSVIAGIIVFPVATFALAPTLGGLLAVVTGSLLGRISRTVAAYVDLFFLTRNEAAAPGREATKND